MDGLGNEAWEGVGWLEKNIRVGQGTEKIFSWKEPTGRTRRSNQKKYLFLKIKNAMVRLSAECCG